MKIVILALLICSYFIISAQNRKIEILFFANGEKVQEVDYYLINGKKAYLQPYIDNQISLPDSLTRDFDLLGVYKKHKIWIPVIRHEEVTSIKVFCDNRVFNNTVRKEYNLPIFKFLFKKNYLTDPGLGDFHITFKLKAKYELIDKW